ncbi:MAG: amino acid adenylation domain-containing protein [Chloroflexi bacterium]|nr:amino acid adenylation domain-containing protein [Chloroflexota bacterium]
MVATNRAGSSVNVGLEEFYRAVPFVLELPTDLPRSSGFIGSMQTVHFELNSEDSALLQSFAYQRGSEPMMVSAAAFAALLYRYTQQEHFVFGCRHKSAAVFNVLRVSAEGKTFSSLLYAIEEQNLSGQAQPVSSVRAALSVVADASRHPVIQAAFSFLEMPDSENFTSSGTPLDIALEVYPQETGLHAAFHYRSDLFTPARIEQMARHWQNLLRAALNEPEIPIDLLAMLSANDREQLLVAWNQTARAFPLDEGVHTLFEAQAARTPTNTALFSGGEQVSFGELNARANQLAHYLQRLGVSSGHFVGISMERSIEAVVSFLAVMKTGAAYVPIDPAYPHERRAFMIADTQLKVLLTQQRLLSVLAIETERISAICVDSAWSQIAQYSSENLGLVVHSEQPAYVIYTSGSTGKPKGVLLPQRALVNHNLAIIERYGLSASDRVLHFASLSFDVAGEEIYPTLLAGAAVVIWPQGAAPAINEFLRAVDAAGVTVLNLPTPYWHEWTYALEDKDSVWPGALRLLVIGSERAAPERLAVWQEKAPQQIPLRNAYGLTETAITSLVYDVPYSALNRSEVPVGRPLANTLIYLLDAYMQPVPPGVAGELYIGGRCVASGYLNRPDLSAERFVANPFSNDPTQRLYKTGDLMRYLPDGNIEFLGRIDQQAKIRGHRVELGEIEAALAQHAHVRRCVVIARDDEHGQKYLAAYLVVQGKALVASKWRSFLKETLPDYMIPAAYVLLETLPLTPNGKIDRKALPAPSFDEHEGEFVAPRTPTEIVLASIWGEILGHSQIGIHDNFYDLGGHSLLAIRIFTQIERRLHKHLPMAVLFNAPTVARLAKIIDSTTESDKVVQHSPIIKIQPHGSRPPFFCVGGGVIDLNHLARQLGNDQPFYALHWQGLAAHQTLSASVDMVAEAFIEEIKSIQPRGPYYLGGCFASGLVAVEIARRLKEQGEEVAFLAAIATVPRPRTVAERAQGKVTKILLGGPAKWRDTLTTVYNEILHIGETIENIQHIFWKGAVRLSKITGRPLPFVLRTGLYEEFAVRRATNNYVAPAFYDGEMTLFLPPGWYDSFSVRPQWGWGEVLANTPQVYKIPGDPCTIFSAENVPVLGAQLKALLIRAQEAHTAAV